MVLDPWEVLTKGWLLCRVSSMNPQASRCLRTPRLGRASPPLSTAFSLLDVMHVYRTSRFQFSHL